MLSEKIKNEFPVHSCSCADCARMCRISPCIPTPQQALQLMAAGYREELMLTTWLSSSGIFLVLAPIRLESGACTFLENELCRLHDQGLKPLEGQMASHVRNKNGFNLRLEICQLWLSQEGFEVLQAFGMDEQDRDLFKYEWKCKWFQYQEEQADLQNFG